MVSIGAIANENEIAGLLIFDQTAATQLPLIGKGIRYLYADKRRQQNSAIWVRDQDLDISRKGT